jgi:hypothetical protein
VPLNKGLDANTQNDGSGKNIFAWSFFTRLSLEFHILEAEFQNLISAKSIAASRTPDFIELGLTQGWNGKCTGQISLKLERGICARRHA